MEGSLCTTLEISSLVSIPCLNYKSFDTLATKIKYRTAWVSLIVRQYLDRSGVSQRLSIYELVFVFHVHMLFL